MLNSYAIQNRNAMVTSVLQNKIFM